MGREQLPHERLELEQDIADIKNGEQPFVPVTSKFEIRCHACNTSISDIAAVKEGKKIYSRINLDEEKSVL